MAILKEEGRQRDFSARAPLPCPSLALGAARVDAELRGGLKRDGLHELYAVRPEDDASALGFALALSRRRQEAGGRPLFWARLSRGAVPYGPGLVDLGLAPRHLALALLPDERALLRAGLDAVRAGAASVVLLEVQGACPLLDLTASRRLTLAAAETGTMVLLARSGATPAPSAAHSRWHVAAAPSCGLACAPDGEAPGAPAFALTLLRHRGGRNELRCMLEWDRDRVLFQERALFQEREDAPALAPWPVPWDETQVARPRAANDRGGGW
ncbi:MAG: ImuA family protein [Sphingobium sp.]